MNYSDKPQMVRVDFFKESGKWGYTEAMEWTGEWNGSYLLHNEFLVSLVKHCVILEKNLDGKTGTAKFRMTGMTVVCLEPYHEHAHPLMIHDWTTRIEFEHLRLI